MELELSTPALLFPAITLLMLAFTNRFLAIANLIRGLHKKYIELGEQPKIKSQVTSQIKNLRTRLSMIKYMQAFGVASFLLCVVCMLLLFNGLQYPARFVFIGSMVTLLISLGISLIEIQISTRALNVELSDMEEFSNSGTWTDFKFTKNK
ncbi:DUF2721 domain-containing protein [Penaeicola halotolerans]|uniref:DUF2721 domain-containing protein n=1 Tax=Penaeicola halotolerans TaxID=2793196 RepID=UPI001CF87D88|nr:DUF2721 domain-containing protein [Penaeicola halotolerans]